MTISAQDHRDMVASLPTARYKVLLGSGVIIFGVVAIAALLQLVSRRPSGGRGELVLLVCATIACQGCAIVLGVHMARVRRASFAHIASSLGLIADPKPVKKARIIRFAPFTALPMLRSGAKGVKSWAGGEISGRRIDFLEHAYVVSTGKSAHVVTHTAIATPCSPAWPRLSLTPRHGMAKLWASITGKDFKVENDAFNDRWRIKTENLDFAILFLTPEVQEFLAHAPSAETWHLGNGSLCCVIRKKIKPRVLPPMLHRVADLRNLLPGELDQWTP